MELLAIILLIVLLVPSLAFLLDTPVGRALARRIEGQPEPEASLATIAKRVELLESEVDDLTRTVQSLQEENAFLQRLIEEAPQRPTLPPPPAS
jgi:hypothetical protein